jgi:hypothetical protein
VLSSQSLLVEEDMVQGSSELGMASQSQLELGDGAGEEWVLLELSPKLGDCAAEFGWVGGELFDRALRLV